MNSSSLVAMLLPNNTILSGSYVNFMEYQYAHTILKTVDVVAIYI